MYEVIRIEHNTDKSVKEALEHKLFTCDSYKPALGIYELMEKMSRLCKGVINYYIMRENGKVILSSYGKAVSIGENDWFPDTIV